RVVAMTRGVVDEFKAADVLVAPGDDRPQRREVAHKGPLVVLGARPLVGQDASAGGGQPDEHPFVKDDLAISDGHAVEMRADERGGLVELHGENENPLSAPGPSHAKSNSRLPVG